MPAAVDKSAKPTVEVTKQGMYNIVIGDSLKRENGHGDGDLFASVKYNFKPPSSLVNSVPPRLTKSEAGGEAPYTLTLTPPNQPSPNHIVYEGAQHIPKKTECILLFDPAKQTFTLEKLSSAFTFNAKVFANAHPPLPLRPPVIDGDDDEISAEEKEDDNPFDYRHFLNKKATTKSRAEQRAEKEQRRKKALIAVGALSENPDDSEGEKGGKDEEESGLGLGITYGGRPPISSRAGKSYSSNRKAGGGSPAISGRKNLPTGRRGVAAPSPSARDQGPSSEESEADNEDNDEDDDEHYRAPPRHESPPHKPAPKNTRPIDDDDMEVVFEFPDMEPLEEEEDISDVDEDSDDEPNPPRAPQQAVPVAAPGQDEGEEEEDDDGYNLAEELEQALESEEDPGLAVQGGDSEIIFEDDDTTSRPRLGLVHKSAVPMSLSGMVGGGVLDESESSEEE
ncbi:RNA polymerase II transcription elongation factor-domain-containing protein [Tuber brumale]|nr:RNA polymerase II transcription elongation factor-domain-containing protein [Tuber brumale]